jgi:hypothetical protein
MSTPNRTEINIADLLTHSVKSGMKRTGKRRDLFKNKSAIPRQMHEGWIDEERM